MSRRIAVLMARADRLIESAKLLIGAGDGEGAAALCCTAMFHAARAALLSEGCAAEAGKTRKQVLQVFEKRTVQKPRLGWEDVKRLKSAELWSDRSGEAHTTFSVEGATRLFSDAVAFLAAVRLAAPRLPAPTEDENQLRSVEHSVEAIVAQTNLYISNLKSAVEHLTAAAKQVEDAAKTAE